MATFDPHKNFSFSTVASAPTPAASGTSLVVTSAASFPATTSFNATIWPTGTQPTSSNAEIVRVTNIATNTFTIVRSQESTSARTILAGDNIALTVTTKLLTDIESRVVGDRNLWLPAKEWFPDTTIPCASLATRSAGAGQDYQHLAFDGTTGELAQTTQMFPSDWNNGTITFTVYWSGITAGAGGVVWRLGGVVIPYLSTYALSAGTQQQATDTFLGVDILHQVAGALPVTLTRTQPSSNVVRMQLFRDPTDVSDTRAQDANMIGVLITYTTQ